MGGLIFIKTKKILATIIFVLSCINMSIQITLCKLIMYIDQLAGTPIVKKNLFEYSNAIGNMSIIIPFCISIYLLIGKSSDDI